MKPTLVVLAAGMGSRYGGVKQMDGFGPGDQWLLEYSVFDAINAGFGKVVFILRDEIIDDFKAYFEKRLPDDIEREYVLQTLTDLPEGYTCPDKRQKPWGTGHAMLITDEVIHEPFAVINADDFYGPEAYSKLVSFLEGVNPANYEFGMIGYRLKKTLSENGSVSRGICEVDEDGFLIEVDENTKIERQEDGRITNEGIGTYDELDGEAVVSMNCWAFSPKVFDQLREEFKDFLDKKAEVPKSEFYIPMAVQSMKDDGLATVKVMTSDDNWFGVTYAEDAGNVKEELAEMHRLGIYPDKLWD